jgi:hypothetical protein
MKKCIKNLAAAIVVAGAVTASQSALAQITFIKNDLYMGFQNSGGGGTADYIVNMGAAANIIGGSTVVNLSSSFSESSFTSAGLSGTDPTQIMGGVVGGTNGTPADIFATVLRTSNVGTPSLAGSTAPAGLTHSEDTISMQDLTQMICPTAGTGILDTTKSWESQVEPAFHAGTFSSDTGINPDSPVTTSSVVYEDLWETTNSNFTGSQPFFYQGYFTLNFTGATAVVTFTPKAAAAQLTAPKILSITKAGSTVTVVSTAVPTFHYQLQAATGLNPASWANAGVSVTATTTLVTNTDTAATANIEFYHVMAH